MKNSGWSNRWTMRTSDGKECSAFIVTKTDQIAPQITGMARELGCCDGSDSGVHQPWPEPSGFTAV